MPFPEKDAAPGAENAQPGAEQQGAEQPGAAPAPGSPQGEQNEQVNMAMIGQALKHIAGLLENIHAGLPKNSGMGGMGDTAAVDSDLNEHDTLETEREGAMDDMSLESAVEGEHEGAMDEGEEQEGEYPMPKQAAQEGTPARGMATPHGAMDRRSVKLAMDAAVTKAIKQERERAARVEEARREVRGMLGEVYGMDSASKIYREALRVAGVDVKQIQKGTEHTAWQAYKLAAGAVAGARPRSEMALDSKSVDASKQHVLGLLSKISVKG